MDKMCAGQRTVCSVCTCTCWVGCVNDHWFELCEAESDCVYVVAATIGFESCASERAVLCVCMCVAMDESCAGQRTVCSVCAYVLGRLCQ